MSKLFQAVRLAVISVWTVASLPGQLVRAGAGSMLIKLASMLIGLALAVVLARALGLKGYGTYSFAVALMNIVVIPAQMGLPTLLVREVARYEGKSEWRHLRGILIRSLQAVVLVAMGIVSVAGFIISLTGDNLSEEQLNTFILTFALLPVVAVGGLLGAGLRGLQHVVKGQFPDAVLRPAMLFTLVTVVFWIRPELCSPVVAMGLHVASGILTLVLVAWWLYSYTPDGVRSAKPRFDTKRWLASAWPLSLVAGAGIINNQTNIIMLGLFTTAEDVGVYRVAVQSATLVAFGLQAINMVAAPHFARLYANSDFLNLQRLVALSSGIMCLVALPIAAGFVFWGDAILTAVFGSKYVVAHEALSILALGQLVNAAMGSVGCLLNMTGYERDTMRGFVISAVVNVLLNLWLIPRLGLIGAATATTITLCLWNILLYRAVRIRLNLNSTIFSILKTGPASL